MDCSKYCSPQPQFFGELHNEAIDYVYEKLKPFQGQTVGGLLGLKVQSTISVALNEFFKANLSLLSEIADTAATNTMEKYYSLNGDLTAFEDYVFSSIFFSPTGTEFLNRLRAAMSGGLSPDELQNVLTSIYDDAFKSDGINGRESEQLLSILQIAIYSSKYWADSSNREKWGALTNTPTTVGRLDWGNVGNADIAGAVGGAVRFGVVAVFGGPVGWGAFAGGTLGGAAAGSVGAAVLGWLN